MVNVSLVTAGPQPTQLSSLTLTQCKTPSSPLPVQLPAEVSVLSKPVVQELWRRKLHQGAEKSSLDM